MKPLVRALRPQQWPKNGVVFAAFVFSAGDAWALDDPGDWGEKLLRIAAMAALWCVASSATYLVNDAFDRDADRLHPKKQSAREPSWTRHHTATSLIETSNEQRPRLPSAARKSNN